MAGSDRRRFLGQLATGVAGGSMTTAFGAETEKKKKGATGSSNREAAANAPGVADLGPGGVATKFWIDPRLAAKVALPWRKIHIEFHNSQHQAKTVSYTHLRAH